MVDNSSSLSLLTVLKPGGSSHTGAEPKPAKTIDQMIDLMTERGLTVTDEAQLRRMLFDCNYYRLSGYFRPFQVNPAAGDNRYRPGTRDVDFLIPYEMDEELRNIILKGTAKVELALRSRFAYLLASDGGAYTYMDPESYQAVRNKRGELLRDNLLRNMDKWMGMSNEVCIRHYRRSGRPVPVWAAVETFPFDTLSRMISLHADAKVLRELYRSVGLRTSLRTSSEVVHAMVYLRNLCSHHARLWHREMVIPSPMTRDMKAAFPDVAYGEKSAASSLLALMYLVEHIEDGNEYSKEIQRFLNIDEEYAAGIATALHWE
ncbi:Abi family protein [Bifidobacterium moukalabense]|uniref:Abi family protein n=1 Tax=Bifidobacterium moukalabense TaxID=1333651 RepID=UPI0010F88B6D|nr:Abi family protein [Bifidobacterium moukalabense]